MKNQFALLTAVLVFGAANAAQAHLIGPTQISQGANSNPSSEISVIEASNASLIPLTYLARVNFNDNGTTKPGEGDYASYFTVSSFSGDPATATVAWDLTGTGFTLEAVAVKTGRQYLNIYTVSDDQKTLGLGDSVLAPDGKDSISHITFFGKQAPITPPGTDIPDGGATFALLGLGAVGIGAARRRA